MTSPISTPPTAEEILAALRPGHPRLIATAEDFARLRESVQRDPVLIRGLAVVKESGTKLLTEPVNRRHMADGKRLLPVSRNVLDRMQTLGILYQLEKDPRWVDRAWAEAKAVAEFKDWNPNHFLDVAEMCHAMALAYDWMFEAWTPEQRQVIKTAILRHALQPALAAYRGTAPHPQSWWVRAENNWNQVCHGGIGLGALALAEEEPQLAGEILQNVVRHLPLAIQHYGPDGAWAEGPSYWAYATKYTVAILAGLQSSLGTDYGLSDFPGLNRAGDFVLACYGATGQLFNFADAKVTTNRPVSAELLWLAKRFHRPEYVPHQQAPNLTQPMDLLWYQPLPEVVPDMPLAQHFRGGSEVVTFRSAWNATDALFLGFKAGDNKISHSNLDLGSFVFEALGERWVVDLGRDNYNLPEYFGKLRWTYYRLRAEGHNTVVLNPSREPDQDPQAATQMIRFVGTGDQPRAVADLTPAYAAHARSVQRGMVLPKLRHLVIRDEIELHQPGEIWWFMHTPAQVQVAEDGRTALLHLQGKKLSVQLHEPAVGRLQVMAAEPLPTSPNPQGQAENPGISKLAIHFHNTLNTMIVVGLFPLEDGQTAEPNPLVDLAKIPLGNW